jgi:hypothetical protein
MAKFLALYMAPVGAMDEMMKNTTKEQRDAQMQMWQKWMDEKKSSIVDMGAPLGKNKRISSGGVSDTRNEVGGYSIVEAVSHDAAAALFSDNPMLEMPGAYVEVLECMPMLGLSWGQCAPHQRAMWGALPPGLMRYSSSHVPCTFGSWARACLSWSRPRLRLVF